MYVFNPRPAYAHLAEIDTAADYVATHFMEIENGTNVPHAVAIDTHPRGWASGRVAAT